MKAALVIVLAALVVCVIAVVVLELVATSRLDQGKEPLVVLATWEIKPALEQIAESYEAVTGQRVDLRFGTSQTLLAQLAFSEQGDFFICISERERARAVEEGLVPQWSRRPVAYLIPAMIVRHDFEIEYLSDIVSEQMTLVIPDPEVEAMGRIAVEIIEAAGNTPEFGEEARALVLAMPPSTPEAVQMVSLGKAEVTIAWGMMQQWEPDFLKVVALDPEEITRVGVVTIGRTRFCRDEEAASNFLRFLSSETAQRLLSKWRYITTRAEAMKAAPDAAFGGEPEVPERWLGGAHDDNPGADE